MNDRLAQVQPRKVWPVYVNRWEPDLVSVHATRGGADSKAEHLRGPDCDDEYCFHFNDAFVGSSVEVQP